MVACVSVAEPPVKRKMAPPLLATPPHVHWSRKGKKKSASLLALAVESEDANTGRGTFRLVRNASAWSFYEDAPGKPGFIAAVDVNAKAPAYADATASLPLSNRPASWRSRTT